jgi:hypothetical protein
VVDTMVDPYDKNYTPFYVAAACDNK